MKTEVYRTTNLRVCLAIACLTTIGLGAPLAQAADGTNTNSHATWSDTNVRSFGAIGDGKADDTAAIQAAIDQAAKKSCDVYLPRGTYRITKTLRIEGQRGLVFRGDNGLPWRHGGMAQQPLFNSSALVWDGEPGGTLLHVKASPSLRFENVNFAGAMEYETENKAGVLLRIETVKGGGSMLYKFENTHFYCADVGLQLGGSPGEWCNSDMIFTYTTFRDLKTGMLVKNHQAVDFLFNYVFGLNCETIFDFEYGGNLMVNNAQLTECRLFLEIGHGGSNVGTFLCNNVRIEGAKGGLTERFQALRAHPVGIATICFNGFGDVQFDWKNNRTESRNLPLFEVGGGAVVTVANSIIHGPLATVNGTASKHAILIVRDSIFTTMDPRESVSANKTGFFKLTNNVGPTGLGMPDVVKWPEAPAEIISSNVHSGAAFEVGETENP